MAAFKRGVDGVELFFCREKKFSARRLARPVHSSSFVSRLPPGQLDSLYPSSVPISRLQNYRHNVQAHATNDGAFALDYQAGQWWLLQGKPNRLHGSLRQERHIQARYVKAPYLYTCPKARNSWEEILRRDCEGAIHREHPKPSDTSWLKCRIC